MQVRTIITTSAILEGLTGIALLAYPVVVVRLLFGIDESVTYLPLSRLAGIALIALGLACAGTDTASQGRAGRGILVYNSLVAVYLAHLGLVAQLVGPLLWPAVGEHVLVALLLVGLPSRRV